MSASVKTHVQHARDAAFDQGLRQYFAYRNLGYDNATSGKFGVNVIRAVPGEHPHGAWHLHELDFQFVYVLKGWVEFEYEDVGHVRLEAGSTVMQPPRIRHREIRHSDDVEILELTSPAEFVTREVEAPQVAAE
ncbi:MAG: cupin domain-containing protein [Rhodoblastus sp.]|nr:cupin domain-containing protein [Rhodoblastus sp.]